MTIESSLESRCGLSHESTQDGCSGTCVKLEASSPPEVEVWYIKGIHRLKGTSIENNSAVNQPIYAMDAYMCHPTFIL